MDYQQNQFLRLIEAVEDQGGTHLDETCGMKTYDEWTGTVKRPKTYFYPGCGHNSMFEIPEISVEDSPPQRSVRVCAVEDAVGLWPRFIDQVFE